MPLPIISVAQMREWENATWASGQTEAEVIRRVGKAIAYRAMEMTRSGEVLLLLAGKGHNGDDVRAAEPHLQDRRVELLNVNDPAAALPEFQSRVKSAALIIDGLFGIGLDRPLDDDWKQFLTAVSHAQIPVLAADVPSGLNADTGDNFGAVVRATVTLTVGAPKQGMLSTAAGEFVGRLEVASDVGLIPCPHQATVKLTTHDDFRGFPPPRPLAGHKGTFGHLGILAGSMGFHGAAILAARGAQRARPGLITLFPQESVYHAVAAQLQSVMVYPWSSKTDLLEKSSAILIGPGMAAEDISEEIKVAMRRYWRVLPVPMIVDASALDWLAQGAIVKDFIRIITPHPGEAARLLRSTTERIQANRLEAIRELSRRYGNCHVVLKGHQTLVGRSSEEIFVNPSGNPNLAQGGTGDVLAGFLAGLIAQPSLQWDAGRTVRYAVWQHGAAADWLEKYQPNWIVEDLVQHLGAVRNAT